MLPRLNWKQWGILATLAVIIGAALWNWYSPIRKPLIEKQFVPVEQLVTKTVTIPGPERIRIIERQVVEKKLPGVQLPEGSNVTATADLPPMEEGGKAVAVIDAQGNSTIQVKENTPPFLGWPNEKEVSLRYGLSAKNGQSGNIAARWVFLRVGAVRVGTYGEIEAPDMDAKAMLEASYRW